MADLLTVTEFKLRVGVTVAATLDDFQVETRISDATALVRQAAAGVLDDVESPAPAAIVPVVVSMVERALVNPTGTASEMLDGYRRDGSHTEGVFMTRHERAAVRAYAGILSAKSLPLLADMPTPETESVPIGQIGWVAT